MADRSAALLVELLGSRTTLPGTDMLSKVLREDPPFVVWLWYQAARHRPGWRPGSLTELAQWVQTRLVELFTPRAWSSQYSPLQTGPEANGPARHPLIWGEDNICWEGDKELGSVSQVVPPDSKTSDFERQVVRDLFRAHLALQLAARASPTNPALTEQVYLIGLIAEADRWIRLGTDYPEPNVGVFFPDWLAASDGPVCLIVKEAKIWTDRLLPPLKEASFLEDSTYPGGEGGHPSGEGASPMKVFNAQGDRKDSGETPEGVGGVGGELPEQRDWYQAYQEAVQRAAQWTESLPGLPQNFPQILWTLAYAHLLETHFAETLEKAKLEALAELAAGAAHEINNPLAVIAGRAQLLLQQASDPEQRRALAVILGQVRRVYEMIADLHLFARPPRPHIQTVELSGLVNRLLEEVQPTAAEQGVSLRRSGHPGPLEILADPAQIQAALRAVVQNGLEAVGRGGLVQIILDTDAEWVYIRVQDNGPGIPPKVRAHLFDPFFSGRSAGRGLGLGLSKTWRIVVGNHQGKIQVESTPGRTCMELLLPKTSSDRPNLLGSEDGTE